MFEESLKNQEEPQSSDMGPVVQQVEINENGNRMTYEGMQLYQNFYHFVNQAKTVFFLQLIRRIGGMDYAYNKTILPHIYMYFVKYIVIVVICYINKIIINVYNPPENSQEDDQPRTIL